jgi:hypothetical protein
MQAQLQRFEGVAGQEDLSIQYEPVLRHPRNRLGQFREKALQGLLALRLKLHIRSLAEGKAAEAIDLRLEDPLGALGKLWCHLGLHRLQVGRREIGWHDGPPAPANGPGRGKFRASPLRFSL